MKKISLLALALAASLNAIETSGTIISENEKIMTSRYMGFVQKVFVSEGQRITAGQTLYTIDSKEMDANKQQVELMIEQAKLGVAMRENQYFDVKKNLERYKRLFDKGLVSKYEVEQLELGEKNLANMVEISKQQLKQAEAGRDSVNNQFKYLEIKAPNSGVVIKKMVKVGEMAIPGMPALIISDVSNLKIMTEVGETELSKMKVGQKVSIQIPSANVNTKATIESIIPSSNPMTHSFAVKLRFPNNGKCYPGMYVKVMWE